MVKMGKTVTLVFAVGLIAEKLALGSTVVLAATGTGGTDTNLAVATTERDYVVTARTEIAVESENAMFQVNTVDDLKRAFDQQGKDLNETFYLNISSSLDVKEIIKQMDAGLTSCSWKVQYTIDKNGTRIATDYSLYMFTVEYRDDFRILQAYNNDKLASKLTANEIEVMKKAQSIIAAIIKPEMSEYEKVLAIHDYIVLNARYESKSDDPAMQKLIHSTEGLLMYGAGVCSSYTGSMYLLLGMVDIETVYVTGSGQNREGLVELHAWNKVKIDGEWYNVDATWNDPLPDKPGEISYAYFAVTDEVLSADHQWSTDVFPQKATSTKYNYYNYNRLLANDYAQFKSIVTEAISEQKDKSEITVRLYVQNYNADTYDLKFIANLLPNVTKLTHTKLSGSTGEFALKIYQEV